MASISHLWMLHCPLLLGLGNKFIPPSLSLSLSLRVSTRLFRRFWLRMNHFLFWSDFALLSALSFRKVTKLCTHSAVQLKGIGDSGFGDWGIPWGGDRRN